MYLDDITLGSSVAGIEHDLEVIESLTEIGLCVVSEHPKIRDHLHQLGHEGSHQHDVAWCLVC